jgi:glycosyltransferase involved in cell wall biosynthesis
MNAPDIMVCPYREILNSGSVLLGISFGKMIIAQSMGCIPEVLHKDHNFLYDPEEKDGLFNTINRAISSEARLQEMGKQNLELDKRLDWRGIAEETLKVYKKYLC